MDKDKQIEELASLIYSGKILQKSSVEIAELIYKIGYCKASEVAREIFEEIDTLIVRRMIPEIAWIDDRFITDITELKKKYTEGEKEK